MREMLGSCIDFDRNYLNLRDNPGCHPTTSVGQGSLSLRNHCQLWRVTTSVGQEPPTTGGVTHT